MAMLVTHVMDTYNGFMDKADPRTVDYPLVASPWPNVAMVMAYIYVVKVAGPRFMKNREPYNIRPFMVFYNFAMVCLSAYMVWEFLWSGWLTDYKVIGCQPVDYSDRPQAIRMTNVSWVYFISKYIEFLDTIFFVLRKKFNHISPLHVFHHSSVPLCIWAGCKWVPGGFGTFFCMLNSSVHTVMYFYYGIAAMGPKYHKYLWWKKYMTIYQLVQFTLMFLHSIQLWFIDCSYPLFYGLCISFLSGLFFYLFIDFYIHAYIRPRSKPSTKHANEKHAKGVAHSNGTVITNGKHHSTSNGVINGVCGASNGLKQD